MEKKILKNEIPIIIKSEKNTPRNAFTIFFSIDEEEKIPGTYSLLNKLFFQGTKKYSAYEIANILDENALECYSQVKSDSLQFKLVALNEDFDFALDILKELIENSTFEEIEKEKIKFKGEIESQLDSPRTIAYDTFYKNIFSGHFYGNTITEILENIMRITKEDIMDAYEKLIINSKKVISIVGDFDESKVKEKINNNFGFIKNNIQEKELKTPVLYKSKVIKVQREDVSQAQIILGYLVDNYKSEDYASLILINSLLGSSGLSSRLFIELRDKKGLAYVVRSSYETFKKAGCFNVYIATNPNNINTSIDGFLEEIEKLKKDDVSCEELENAKENVIGKRNFLYETNLSKANMYSYYEIMDLGFDFEEKLIKMIKNVTIKDIKNVADKYFNDKFVLTLLSNKKSLDSMKNYEN